MNVSLAFKSKLPIVRNNEGCHEKLQQLGNAALTDRLRSQQEVIPVAVRLLDIRIERKL